MPSCRPVSYLWRTKMEKSNSQKTLQKSTKDKSTPQLTPSLRHDLSQQLEEILRQCERDLRDMGLVEEDLNSGTGNAGNSGTGPGMRSPSTPLRVVSLSNHGPVPEFPVPEFPEFPVPEKSFSTPVFRFIWLKLTKPLREQAQFYSKGMGY